jgi:hypothetical protein
VSEELAEKEATEYPTWQHRILRYVELMSSL